jgi:hypothetical protein
MAFEGQMADFQGQSVGKSILLFVKNQQVPLQYKVKGLEHQT